MCAGKIYCEMFRDKKYCMKAPDRENRYKECECRHAKRLCEVEHCSIEEFCPLGKSIYEIETGRSQK